MIFLLMGTVVGDELAVNKENIRIIPRNKNTIGDGGSTAMGGWMGGLDTPYTVYMNNQTSGQYPEILRKYSDILLGSSGRCRVGKGSDRHCHHPSLINLSNTFFLFNSNFYHPFVINLSNTFFSSILIYTTPLLSTFRILFSSSILINTLLYKSMVSVSVNQE